MILRLSLGDSDIASNTLCYKNKRTNTDKTFHVDFARSLLQPTRGYIDSLPPAYTREYILFNSLLTDVFCYVIYCISKNDHLSSTNISEYIEAIKENLTYIHKFNKAQFIELYLPIYTQYLVTCNIKDAPIHARELIERIATDYELWFWFAEAKPVLYHMFVNIPHGKIDEEILPEGSAIHDLLYEQEYREFILTHKLDEFTHKLFNTQESTLDNSQYNMDQDSRFTSTLTLHYYCIQHSFLYANNRIMNH